MCDFLSRYIIWILILLMLGPLFSGVRPAEAGLQYSFLEEINEDVSGIFHRKNQHRLSAGAEQELTKKITINEHINFSRKWEEGKGTDESISPSVGMLLENSYFALDIQGSTRQRFAQQNLVLPQTDVVELNWNSRWKETIRAPGLRFSVNHKGQSSSSSLRPIDIDSSAFNSSVAWDLLFAKLFYNYTRTEDMNYVSHRGQNSEKHFVRLNGAHGFFEKKLRISYGQTFRESTAEQVVEASAGTALIGLLVPEIRTGVDSPLDLIDLPAASVNGQMIDGNLVATAYSIPQNTTDHNFLMVVNGQQVDFIYLYAQDNWGGGVPPALANWRLYSTNTLGTPWTVEPLNVAAITYDVGSQCLVIPVPSVQRSYLKLVVDRNPIALPPIDIAEAELYRVIFTGGAGAVFVSKQQYSATSFGMNYDLSPNSLLKYTVGLIKEESSIQEIDNLFQTFSWAYASEDNLFRSSLYFADLRQENTRFDKDTARQTYGVDLQKNLLPTLHLGFGASREDITINGQSAGQWDRFSLYFDAQLYPDLQAKLDGQHQKGSFPSINGGQEISTATFTLSSRPSPSIVSTFSEQYDERRNSSQVLRSYASTLSSSWTLSKWLTTNASVKYIDDETSADTRQGSIRFHLNLNGKMNFDVDYTVSKTIVVVHSGSASWVWPGIIIKNLDLMTRAQYSKVEGNPPGNDWLLTGTLRYSFAF